MGPRTGGILNNNISDYKGRRLEVLRYKKPVDIDRLEQWIAKTTATAKGYDLEAIFGFLTGIPIQDDNNWFCSELAYWLYQENGYLLTREDMVLMYPAHLHFCNEFEKIDDLIIPGCPEDLSVKIKGRTMGEFMKKRIFLAAMALVLAGCVTTGTTPGQVDTQQLLSDVIDLAIKVQANKSASIPTPIPPAPVPVPVPLPTPEPVPVPPPPVQPVQAQITVWDADKIPDMMRQFVMGAWSENQLFWALFTCYGSHVGDFSPDVADLGAQCGKIKAWFTAYVQGIGNQLKANPGMTATECQNDRNDAGFLFMYGPIEDQLRQMGVNMNQVRRGTWWDGSKYVND